MNKKIKLLKQYKKQIIGVSIIFIIILCIILNNKEEVIEPVKAAEPILEEVKEIENISIETKEETIKIDIKGEINNPGVYELESGKRIIDAIEISGGLTSKAITKDINLSKKLVDEMVIYIPDMVNTCEIKEDINNDNGLININTASKEQLDSLSGIGESKALAIIEYRKENKFNVIEDLMNVSGISESLFNKIKDEITT